MAVLTVFLTVISGVITYVLGQIALKLFIRHCQRRRLTMLRGRDAGKRGLAIDGSRRFGRLPLHG